METNNSPEKKVMDKELLSSIGELFSRTWSQYKQRALPIFAVILISTVILGGLSMITVLCGLFGGAILTHVMPDTTAIAIMAVLLSVLLLGIAILFIWCQTTLVAIVVDEDLGIIESFERGWAYLWPMVWVVTILSGILMTGFTLGVLPGFLYLVWFSFCPFILLMEDRRGIDTLLISREYVRGYGWNTFGKMLPIWLISLMAGTIPFLGQILSILFTPFMMLYFLGLYNDLKTAKGMVEPKSGKAGRIFWWAVAIIGLILPIAALLGLLYFLLTGEQQWITPAWEGMHRASL